MGHILGRSVQLLVIDNLSSFFQMAYAIVEFLHLEQVDVVPALWIQGEHCAWPHQAKGDKIIVMVKKAVPPDVSWKRFAVAVKGLFGMDNFRM